MTVISTAHGSCDVTSMTYIGVTALWARLGPMGKELTQKESTKKISIFFSCQPFSFTLTMLTDLAVAAAYLDDGKVEDFEDITWVDDVIEIE